VKVWDDVRKEWYVDRWMTRHTYIYGITSD
jgi:hypothetical protein